MRRRWDGNDSEKEESQLPMPGEERRQGVAAVLTWNGWVHYRKDWARGSE